MITIDCGGMSFLHNYVGICPLDDAPFEVVSCVSLPTLMHLKKNTKTYYIQICTNDSYLPNVLQLRVA